MTYRQPCCWSAFVPNVPLRLGQALMLPHRSEAETRHGTMMELEQLLSYCGANGRSSDVARGRPRATGDCARIGFEHQEQSLGGLDTPRGGSRPKSGSGEALTSQNAATHPTCRTRPCRRSYNRLGRYRWIGRRHSGPPISLDAWRQSFKNGPERVYRCVRSSLLVYHWSGQRDFRLRTKRSVSVS
jgi:hypothetical protein